MSLRSRSGRAIDASCFAFGLTAFLARSVAAQEQPPQPVKPPAETAAEPRKPSSPAYELRAGGFVQLDWVVHREISEDQIDPSTGKPLNQDRFLLRRGRLRLEADQGYALGRIELDANTVGEPEVRPYDVNVGVRWPRAERPFQSTGTGHGGDTTAAELVPPAFSVMATLGLFRIPFGFDTVESATARPYLERTTFVRAFFPGARDFGIGIDASYRFVRLAVALMNGAPIGEAGFGGLDPEHEKDWIGRVGVDLPIVKEVRFQAGVSGLSGTGLHAGTPATKDQLAWTDGNENGLVEVSELTVIPGVPAQPSLPFERFAVGADARVLIAVPILGMLMLRGEIARAQNLDRGVEPADPVSEGRPLRELGWYVGLSQEITRYVEVGARYDVYVPDDDARRQAGVALVNADSKYETLAIAAATRVDRARLMLEYDHNKNRLGRAPSGAPATLRDDAFVLRGELVF